MDYAPILPNLFVGSHPRTREDVERLQREAGMTAVLNLQTSQDFADLGIDWPALAAHYRLCGIEVHRVPVRDFDEDDLCATLPNAVRKLSELLQAGHSVLVHCSAGTGRSPSVVIAYLHWVQGRDLDEAARFVGSRRTCTPNLNAIRGADPPQRSR